MTYVLILLFKILDYWVQKNPKGIVFSLAYYSFIEQVVGHVPQVQKYLESDLAQQTFYVRERDSKARVFRAMDERRKFAEALEAQAQKIKELTTNPIKSPAMQRNFTKR